MSAEHYWLGRIHGMREARAIVESCLRVGMELPSALATAGEIADEIRFELNEGNKRMLSPRFTRGNLEDLAAGLFRRIVRPA